MRKPQANLSKDSLTRAARIMLPTYPLLCFWLGLSNLLITPERVKESPALRFLDDAINLQLLGTVLLLIGGFMLLALGLSNRLMYQCLLAALFGVEFTVGVIYIGASYASNASYAAGAYPLFIALAAWASLMSLNSRETG